jgi:KaiC/GvpD/RAD55 family RecA-like ATPase
LTGRRRRIKIFFGGNYMKPDNNNLNDRVVFEIADMPDSAGKLQWHTPNSTEGEQLNIAWKQEMRPRIDRITDDMAIAKTK